MNSGALEVREVSPGYGFKAAKPAVPAGYKQTEVGVIPEDWDVASVRQKGEVLAGKALAVNAPGEQRPYLRTKNVFDGRIDVTDVLSMPMTDEQFRQFQVRKGDVLLNEGQSLELVGRCAIYQDEYPEPCAMQNALLRFRAHSGVCSNYASHLFRYCQDIGIFARIALQTTSVAHLGSSRFEKLQLAWPTEPEQRAIATALSDADALLEELDHLIAKKRDIKQAIMQQLLTGQIRLPGFEGEWEIKHLGYTGHCLRGVSYEGGKDLSAYETSETIRLLRSNNVQMAAVQSKDIQHVKAERVSPQQIMNQKDILICMANGSKALVGKAGAFKLDDGFAYTFGAFMGNFRTDETKADPSFIFLLFQTNRYREYINLLLAGSSINNLRPSSIESMEFQIPPIKEQKAIANILQDMDAEILALEKQRYKTFIVKQAMMQELLTGRTRLVNSAG